jgi:putative hydrolase of HD superfamily
MESISKFIFEAGMLKRVKRSGWWAEKIKDPETVAEHSHRTAILAFILARMEGLDTHAANRLCTAAVFHDLHEARIGDMHKIAARYIHITRDMERKVETEQALNLPKDVRESVMGALELGEKEQTILKDADYMECAFQAKEYADSGCKGAESWIHTIGERLKTDSARRLLHKMRGVDSNSWWKGLKRLE